MHSIPPPDHRYHKNARDDGRAALRGSSETAQTNPAPESVAMGDAPPAAPAPAPPPAKQPKKKPGGGSKGQSRPRCAVLCSPRYACRRELLA